MKIMDGITKPDMVITQLEFEANDSLARVINGKIFLGKTKEEKKKEADSIRVAEIDNELSDIDIQSARCSRAVACAFATGKSPAKEDVAKVEEYEVKAQKLRAERSKLIKDIESM